MKVVTQHVNVPQDCAFKSVENRKCCDVYFTIIKASPQKKKKNCWKGGGRIIILCNVTVYLENLENVLEATRMLS